LGKPLGKRPCGRLRHTWVENIKMIFRRACVKVPGDRLPWWAVVNVVMDPEGFHKSR